MKTFFWKNADKILVIMFNHGKHFLQNNNIILRNVGGYAPNAPIWGLRPKNPCWGLRPQSPIWGLRPQNPLPNTSISWYISQFTCLFRGYLLRVINFIILYLNIYLKNLFLYLFLKNFIFNYFYYFKIKVFINKITIYKYSNKFFKIKFS